MMTKTETMALVVANEKTIHVAVRKTCAAMGRAFDADAEADLASDAMLALLSGKMEKHDSTKSAPGTFIYMVTRNMVIDAVRKAHFENSPEYDTCEAGKSEEGAAAFVASGHFEAPDAAMLRVERCNMVSASLSSDEAEDFAEFLSPDYSETDYATRKGLTLNNARVRKARLFGRVKALVA